MVLKYNQKAFETEGFNQWGKNWNMATLAYDLALLYKDSHDNKHKN